MYERENKLIFLETLDQHINRWEIGIRSLVWICVGVPMSILGILMGFMAGVAFLSGTPDSETGYPIMMVGRFVETVAN